MKNNLRSLGLVVSLQIFATLWSRATAAESCSRKAGIRIEQITEPVSLGEGPHWDVENQVLYFVDIPGQKIYCWDPATDSTTSAYIKNGMVGVAIPVAGKKNTFVAGAGTDFVEVTWDPKTNSTDPKLRVLATIDVDRKGTRFNDGKIDPKGRFWGGTMAIDETPKQGSLYRIGSDFVPHRIITPVTISNGLTWSHDNTTFYYIDSPTKQIHVYDYDNESGNITNERVLFDFKKNNVPGIPDGMTIDAAGNLWIASFFGGRVIHVDAKTGNLLDTIKIPAEQVTSAAFGGPNLDILYVTTARQKLSDKDLESQPLAGATFSVTGLAVGGKRMLGFTM